MEKKFTKDKEVDPPESDVFSSMLSCSCLQSSSSRVTTTAGSTTEVMCSCCGKFVIDSESSLMLGNILPVFLNFILCKFKDGGDRFFVFCLPVTHFSVTFISVYKFLVYDFI